MSTWNILRNTTNPQTGQPTVDIIATADSIEYHGEWMGDEYILVTVNSSVAIDFQLNDYITYRDESYYLNNDANVVKKARSGTSGEGFVYSNIKFYAVSHLTRTIDFKDIVLEDNMIPYTSLSEFSFFAASVEDLADRLQANLNRVSGDWNVYTPNWSRCDERGVSEATWDDYYGDDPSTYGSWGVTGTAVTLGEKDINVSITSDQRCWDALALSYSSFGLSFYVKGYDIFIGAPALRPGHIFRYGKGNGLYEVERTSDDQQELITKVWAYGSTQNIPTNYYALQTKVPILAVSKYGIDQTYPNMILAAEKDVSNYVTYQIHQASRSFDYLDFGDEYTYVDVSLTTNGTTYTCMFVPNKNKPEGFTTYPGILVITDSALETIVSEMSSNFFVFYITDHIYRSKWDGQTEQIGGVSTYPSLLSINKLMLPGFPTMSLHDWLSGVAGGSISGVKAGGLSASDATILLGKYYFSGYLGEENAEFNPWIMSRNSEYVGELEGVVNYDGSSQEDIHPSIEEFTVSGTRIDQIVSAPTISDNGIYEDKTPDTFNVTVNDGGIDWKSNIDTIVLSMKDGYCVGRDFTVTQSSRVVSSGTWTLTMERCKDDAIGRYFPYAHSGNLYQIMAGDHYVVTGIPLPDSLVIAASVRLLIAACGWLDKRDHVRYTYVPKIDEIRMARQHQATVEHEEVATYGTVSLHDTIKAGMQLQVEDSDLGIERYGDVSPFIDQLTIKEGSTPVPEYDVVLRDEKEKSALEKLTEKVSDLKANPPTQVVERQQRTLQYIEYESWSENGSYYFETLNTTTDVLETSMVWHKGCLWMCKRTLTTDEPWFTSEDWECVRSSALSLDFFDSLEDPMPVTGLSVRPASIDETVVPFFLISQQDISDEVTNWAWERDSGDADSDGLWNGLHTGALMRTLHLTTSDFPSGWQNNGGKVKFTCTATFPWSGENAQISNQITVV